MGRPDPEFNNNGGSTPGMVEMTMGAATTKTTVTYGEAPPVALGSGDDSSSKKCWWRYCRNNHFNLSGMEYIYVGIMVVAVLAVVVTVSLVVALRSDDEIQYAPRATPVPTNKPTTPPYPTPSPGDGRPTRPSRPYWSRPVPTTPTPPPTPVPTATAWATLPGYTQASIQDSGSPQRKAINWVSNDYESDLDNMEEWRKFQLLALATLFFASDGTRWQIPTTTAGSWWLETTNFECDWYNSAYDDSSLDNPNNGGNPDFPICNEKGEIQALHLQGLAGGDGGKPLTPAFLFPRELSLMTSLKSIHLNNNNFYGKFKDVPFMDSLEDLSMTNNALYGSLPTTLGRLINLQKLDLSHNWFRGNLPSQMGLMTSLKVLNLSNNPQLNGSIPPEVLALPDLEILNITNTRLTQ